MAAARNKYLAAHRARRGARRVRPGGAPLPPDAELERLTAPTTPLTTASVSAPAPKAGKR